MNQSCKPQSPFLGITWGMIKKQSFILALLLAFGLIVGFGVPGQAEQTGIGVLLQETGSWGASAQPVTSRTEDALLLSLKQVNLDFTTIHLKEFDNFKGNLVIIPLYHNTPKAFLDAVIRKKADGTHFLLLPMGTQPSIPVESFLQAMGFAFEGSQYMLRSSRLQMDGQPSNVTLPIGSFVYKVFGRKQPLAQWENGYPAAVVAGKAMLINWNWNAPLPSNVLESLLSTWQSQDRMLALWPAPAGMSNPVASIPNPGAKSASHAMLATHRMEKSQPVRMAQAAANPAPHTAAAAPVVIDDPTPDELYEFDGGPDRETIARRRSKETQNAIAEFYNDRMRELGEMQDKVSLLAGQYMNHPEKRAKLEKALQEAAQEKSKFETAWFQQNYGPALAAFDNCRSALMRALFDKVPSNQIEGRAIWLDRGSIVRSGSPEGLRQLIRKIAAAGFNVIYFETVNAGYPIYPSQVTEQNPQTKGWDPLAVAIEEAHQNGMELHAWVWVFAVGNIRHNRILGQPDSFPGPILSRSDMASEALRGANGELVPANQYEYWLSPASPKARQFLITLFSEIVSQYPVDGLQLDYIRYPFQKYNAAMGYENRSVSKFNAETGLSVSESGEYIPKAWVAWKAFQVTTFVKELSHRVKETNPKLKLSVAVFPMARYSRMLMIQQDWETWVRNGWVDTINPMAYSRSARSLERLVEYIHNISNDKALVYPGLSLIRLNAVELLDTLEICRKTGVMGTTLFAFNQFDPDKQLLLQTGPYKQRKTIPPHRDPLYASSQLIAETQGMVENLLKSEQPLPGVENLRQMQHSLKTVGDAITQLKQSDTANGSKSHLISAVRDDSKALEQFADQWSEWSQDSIVGYQAKILKQMVEKVVRMVNYATFQLAPAQ